MVDGLVSPPTFVHWHHCRFPFTGKYIPLWTIGWIILVKTLHVSRQAVRRWPRGLLLVPGLCSRAYFTSVGNTSISSIGEGVGRRLPAFTCCVPHWNAFGELLCVRHFCPNTTIHPHLPTYRSHGWLSLGVIAEYLWVILPRPSNSQFINEFTFSLSQLLSCSSFCT